MSAVERLALISDIHGNVAALEAVLADLDARGIEAFRAAHPKLRITPGLVLCPTSTVVRLSELDTAIPWDLSPTSERT